MFETDLDILSGRVGLTNKNPGNMRFRDEARHFRAEYHDNGTSKERKFELSRELLQRVREYGGRFLQKSADQLWYEMNENECRKKCSNTLREEKWN